MVVKVKPYLKDERFLNVIVEPRKIIEGSKDWYTDSDLFAKNTVLTKHMLDILDEFVHTIKMGVGRGVLLNASFGGGKSHTLAFIIHVFNNPEILKEVILPDSEQVRAMYEENLEEYINALKTAKGAFEIVYIDEHDFSYLDENNKEVRKSLIEVLNEKVSGVNYSTRKSFAEAFRRTGKRPIVIIDETARVILEDRKLSRDKIEENAHLLREFLYAVLDVNGFFLVSTPKNEASLSSIERHALFRFEKEMARLKGQVREISPVTGVEGGKVGNFVDIMRKRIFEYDPTDVEKAVKEYKEMLEKLVIAKRINLDESEIHTLVEEFRRYFPFTKPYIQLLVDMSLNNKKFQKTRHMLYLTHLIASHYSDENRVFTSGVVYPGLLNLFNSFGTVLGKNFNDEFSLEGKKEHPLSEIKDLLDQDPFVCKNISNTPGLDEVFSYIVLRTIARNDYTAENDAILSLLRPFVDVDRILIPVKAVFGNKVYVYFKYNDETGGLIFTPEKNAEALVKIEGEREFKNKKDKYMKEAERFIKVYIRTEDLQKAINLSSKGEKGKKVTPAPSTIFDRVYVAVNDKELKEYIQEASKEKDKLSAIFYTDAIDENDLRQMFDGKPANVFVAYLSEPVPWKESIAEKLAVFKATSKLTNIIDKTSLTKIKNDIRSELTSDVKQLLRSWLVFNPRYFIYSVPLTMIDTNNEKLPLLEELSKMLITRKTVVTDVRDEIKKIIEDEERIKVSNLYNKILGSHYVKKSIFLEQLKDEVENRRAVILDDDKYYTTVDVTGGDIRVEKPKATISDDAIVLSMRKFVERVYNKTKNSPEDYYIDIEFSGTSVKHPIDVVLKNKSIAKTVKKIKIIRKTSELPEVQLSGGKQPIEDGSKNEIETIDTGNKGPKSPVEEAVLGEKKTKKEKLQIMSISQLSSLTPEKIERLELVIQGDGIKIVLDENALKNTQLITALGIIGKIINNKKIEGYYIPKGDADAKDSL